MTYLIDAYNCMHAGAAMGGPLKGLTIWRLARWIAPWALLAKVQVTLVLDGRRKPDEPADGEPPMECLHMHWAGAGVSADLVISQILQARRGTDQFCVITNDRAVAGNARKQRAQVQGCEGFLLGLLAPKQGRDLPADKISGLSTPGELEHWLKTLGLDA